MLAASATLSRSALRRMRRVGYRWNLASWFLQRQKTPGRASATRSLVYRCGSGGPPGTACDISGDGAMLAGFRYDGYDAANGIQRQEPPGWLHPLSRFPERASGMGAFGCSLQAAVRK